jgi:hypothetical protein
MHWFDFLFYVFGVDWKVHATGESTFYLLEFGLKFKGVNGTIFMFMVHKILHYILKNATGIQYGIAFFQKTSIFRHLKCQILVQFVCWSSLIGVEIVFHFEFLWIVIKFERCLKFYSKWSTYYLGGGWGIFCYWDCSKFFWRNKFHE